MAVAERILNLRPLADTRPDRALVHEAQLGDPEASSVLIERYYPRIYSFVSHLTYGRGSAEDLTQEVFARALKALGRFNGQYQFEHWLLRIAKNLCIDEARRNIRSPELTDPGELPELEGIPAPDYVWETVSQELVASVVRRALTALPSRHRAVLVMREMEGMSYADIAQVIGTNPRGVEATLRRARLRFRMEIARADSVEEGQATCRRVLRLVADDPAGSRSEEATAHLAHCAECRRASRAAQGLSPSKAFGFIPLVGLLKGWAALQHGGSTVSASVRRVGGRMKDVSMMAGLGLGGGAVLAAPIARMAEVTTGVLVATVVIVAPMSQAATPVAVTETTYVPAAQVQVAGVPSVAVLYKASTSSQQISSTRTVFPTASAPVTPSIVGTPSIVASTTPDIMSTLNDATGNLVNGTLDGVESITQILTSQLDAVSQLTNNTVAEVTSPLAQLAPVVNAVTGTVTTVTGGVGNLLKGVGSEVNGLTTEPNGSSGDSASTSSTDPTSSKTTP
ncbi:MAG: sigma-70 family RNA polymerase sigma factor [Actinomycetota bacterium]